MPPKKEGVPKSPETPKNGKGGITKRTPSKSTPSKSSETAAERDLMFLWKIIRLSGGVAPNHEVLSKEYGVSTNASSKRWFRLKKKMEAAEEAEAEKKNAAKTSQREADVESD